MTLPNTYKYRTHHNGDYGWQDNLLDVLIDDTLYFNPQAALWPTRPKVEGTITAMDNRIDISNLVTIICIILVLKTKERKLH